MSLKIWSIQFRDIASIRHIVEVCGDVKDLNKWLNTARRLGCFIENNQEVKNDNSNDSTEDTRE